jgi:chromosome partitioning protein
MTAHPSINPDSRTPGRPTIHISVKTERSTDMTPTITAVGNQKGGVGKTATTLGIADALAAADQRVLVLDLDPQANLTTTLEAAGEYDMFDVLSAGEAGTLGQAIVPTSWAGIHAVPGSTQLARIEAESMIAPELRLKTAAWDAAELEGYDHILNALIYAHQVIVVTEAESFSVAAVGQYLHTVQAVRKNPQLNPGLRLAGILVNQVSNPRTNEHSRRIAELQEAFGAAVRAPLLPHRAAVTDANSTHTPITTLKGAGAAVMRLLYSEHARWIREEAA